MANAKRAFARLEESIEKGELISDFDEARRVVRSMIRVANDLERASAINSFHGGGLWQYQAQDQLADARWIDRRVKSVNAALDRLEREGSGSQPGESLDHEGAEPNMDT